MTASTAARIVIAGGGFGGLAVARDLEAALPPGTAQVTLVNEHNFMLYTPFMGAVAGGSLDPRHIAFPLREELPRTRVRLARVEGGDPEQRLLNVRDPQGEPDVLAYDHLVVCLGFVSRTPEVPGLVEHGLGFKTLAEAVALRDRLLRTLERAETIEDPDERASYLSFVVVGAGYAGLAALAEMQAFAADVVQLYPRCQEQGMRWFLVNSRERMISDVPERLARFAEEKLRERGVEIVAQTRVVEVAPDGVRLASGAAIATRTVVWTAGVAPTPVVRRLGLPLDRGGRIVVDECMRVDGHPGIWALGDAAAVPDPARPGEACPPSRQHAVRQAHQMAANLTAATTASGPPGPFTYRTRGVFVDLGRFSAVAVLLRLRMSGFPAWLLTRGYHLKQVPGPRRKISLISDWIVDLFDRDTTELGEVGHPITAPAGMDALEPGRPERPAA